jgi:hypothetical protein
MQHSDSIKELAVALHKAQGKFKSALKDSSNPHFRSKYADLTSVIDAVKPALNSEGIVFLQGLSSSENGVVVETMLLHVSGEWISEKLEIPASKHDAQGYGSACTYGRRYGLQAMCGVPAEDDDGNAASASAPSRITPVAGSLAALPKEEQQKARDIAADIVELWMADKQFAAYEAYYEQGYTNEFMLGIWDVLTPNSKVRNGLKKIHEANKQKVA